MKTLSQILDKLVEMDYNILSRNFGQPCAEYMDENELRYIEMKAEAEQYRRLGFEHGWKLASGNWELMAFDSQNTPDNIATWIDFPYEYKQGLLEAFERYIQTTHRRNDAAPY